LHGGVEPERDVGSVDVVVDGLGHADHGEPFLAQSGRGAERAVATNHHEDLDARLGKDRLT
jgi:hypothetical protein